MSTFLAVLQHPADESSRKRSAESIMLMSVCCPAEVSGRAQRGDSMAALEDTWARRPAAQQLKDGLFNHPGPRAAGPDVSTWKTIRSERVRTHHHSDVLGQIPGAPLEEIREGGLRRNTAVYTHTHTGARTQRQRNQTELHFIMLPSLKKDHQPATLPF